MHDLVKVNGQGADPIFTYLKKEAPGTLGAAVKWNFTKFLIDRQGQVVARYAPQTSPNDMIPDIERLLAE